MFPLVIEVLPRRRTHQGEQGDHLFRLHQIKGKGLVLVITVCTVLAVALEEAKLPLSPQMLFLPIMEIEDKSSIFSNPIIQRIQHLVGEDAVCCAILHAKPPFLYL